MTRAILSAVVTRFGTALSVGGIQRILPGGTRGYLVLGFLLLLSAGLHRGTTGFRGYAVEGWCWWAASWSLP